MLELRTFLRAVVQVFAPKAGFFDSEGASSVEMAPELTPTTVDRVDPLADPGAIDKALAFLSRVGSASFMRAASVKEV